jgi:hypothetical protein
MGDSTDESGWGLPLAAFLRSLCPPLPPPWPPQRPDLIPPWQDPVERQRAAQAAAEAERARADEEETLQFIRDYVQALRDWRKEIVFHWGDHVIGRNHDQPVQDPVGRRTGRPGNEGYGAERRQPGTDCRNRAQTRGTIAIVGGQWLFVQSHLVRASAGVA